MSKVYTLGAHYAGEWHDSSGARIEVRNPATNAVIGTVPQLDASIANEVLDAATRGAATWRDLGVLKRGEILFRAAQILRERSAELIEIIVQENGKTRAEATGEVAKSAEFFEYYGGMSRDSWGYLLADARPNTRTEVRYEPIGVVVAITPWNDPLLTPARKIAPALISGNAVIMKPASDTPIIALELTRALVDAGLPAGVLSTVPARGGELTDVLLVDPRVAGVTFTGSTEVGLHLQASLAGRNIRVQTEMGGKNATVVCADANLDLAVDTVIAGGFGQAGQRCTATSRVLVATDIAPEFSARLSERARQIVVGDGLVEGTQLGALINARHRDAVLNHIKVAVSEGAEVLAGGTAPENNTLAEGAFVVPTVLGSITEEATIWREEVFGPVIALRTFDVLADAINEVNASEYGLSAAIFTTDLHSAETFVDSVHTGQVSVNLPTSGWDIHHPFGGFKSSGSAYKEQGTEVLNFYTRVKTAAIKSA